ncbi:MAG TPA: hypothetical protein VJS69_12800 [Candidatus Krumholzibacteria bacterium]|nr:hypothetical protein [Candidatus Krumholzibacteria bacterium]
MRKPMLVLLSLVLAVVMWGCGDRGHESGGSPVNPPVHTGEVDPGELHNEVMMAFQKRAPLESIPSMQWDEWLETTLNSMEEVCVTHDIPFDREEMSKHIVQLVKLFGAIHRVTGIDPGNLRNSEDPMRDFGRVITQMQTWNVIDKKMAAEVLTFRVDDAARARAEAITDASLRDVFRIGASSREFWLAHEKRTPIEALGASDGEPPCKKCRMGSAISDFLGGMVGRLMCGGDRTCRAMVAAASSLLFDLATGYCLTHPCGDGWIPPIGGSW